MTNDEAITILRTTVEENLFNDKPTTDAQKRLYEAMLMGEVALNVNRLISCKEKMPEPYKKVLCFNSDNGSFTINYSHLDDENKIIWYDHIDYWMPLPDPYKEKDNGMGGD
jgi:hypothetical protein